MMAPPDRFSRLVLALFAFLAALGVFTVQRTGLTRESFLHLLQFRAPLMTSTAVSKTPLAARRAVVGASVASPRETKRDFEPSPQVGQDGDMPATQDAAPALERWIGEWEGEMVNLRGRQASDPIPVKLRIQPLADGTFEWRTLYNDDLERGLKDYRVVPDAADPSKFTMDEQNGILLPLRLVEDVIYAPFEVAGQHLLSRYSFESNDTLRHEVIVWSDDSSSTSTGTGPAGEGGRPVLSFEVSNVQRTIFKRAPD